MKMNKLNLSNMEALYFISGVACALAFNKVVDAIESIVVKIYLIKNKKTDE